MPGLFFPVTRTRFVAAPRPYLYIGGSRARNDLIVLTSEPLAHRVRTLTGIEGA
jgi:hypothetical protein